MSMNVLTKILKKVTMLKAIFWSFQEEMWLNN